jgi:tRNA pseudouridine32 synthase/23S rRNA pseudouridine746 synthase
MKEVLGEANTETGISLTEKRGTLGVYKLEPVTGKMHQLRVHMSSLGIPIINDRLYPTAQTIRPDDFSSPLKLLARSLSFIDPISGDDRVFESRQNLF